MNSEKAKEIKEALECCTNNKGCEPCPRLSKKPYHLDDCRFALLADILILINELESENERLKTQLAQANAGIVNCSGCKLVELNAVNEFAEKLKEEFIKSANIQDSITAKKLFRDICPVKVDKVLKKTLKEFIDG